MLQNQFKYISFRSIQGSQKNSIKHFTIQGVVLQNQFKYISFRSIQGNQKNSIKHFTIYGV